MKLALIPPVAHLDYTRRTDYQLVLAHLLADKRYGKNYALHYSRLRNASKNEYIIIDNGAAEGSTVSDEVLLSMARFVGADEIVMPDVLGDSEATIERGDQFVDAVAQRALKYPELTEKKYGFVAQGKSVQECIYTATAAFQDGSELAHWVDVLYLPRLLINETQDTSARIKAALELRGLCLDYELDIHFLGASPLAPYELFDIATRNKKTLDYSHVRGMDTSMPFNWAFSWCTLDPVPQSVLRLIHRPDNYFDLEMSQQQEAFADWNIREMLRWIS